MADSVLIHTVAQAQQGDPRAFDLLVRQFQNRAVAYARTLLPDSAAAEDAAQEAFVQAWRDLPGLLEPATFGAWLRRIVFKFCDRVRRSARPTLPLADTLRLSTEEEPASVVERTDDVMQVRAAVDALPCSLRAVTLLYYLSGHDVKEIAAFLELPPSTVKNRLHAARKRLRKELWNMAETVLEQEKPSQNDTFADSVLARILKEFQRQEAADPQTANRGLLEEGKTALFQMLEQTPPQEQTVRDGFILLWRKWDFNSLSALLMRYLRQPLADPERAWAYVHLANAIAMSGSAAGAILAHEAFEEWMPGKSPRLSTNWPYYPVSEDTNESAYIGEEVRLLFLSQSAEFTTSYLSVWRNDDYLHKVDTALAEIPVTEQNRDQRFFVLRMACNACEAADNIERARYYIQQMYALSEGAEDEGRKLNLRARALGHAIRLARKINDAAEFQSRVEELTALLNTTKADWIRGERHNLACELIKQKQYDLALPLWEANNADGGQVNGWGWLQYAATIWQLTADRERTLALLRATRAREDRDLLPLFLECPEFVSVHEDAEFLAAVSR